MKKHAKVLTCRDKY